MHFVFVLLLNQITDLFKLNEGFIRIIDHQEIHHFNDVLIKVLHLTLMLGFSQEVFESVVLFD